MPHDMTEPLQETPVEEEVTAVPEAIQEEIQQAVQQELEKALPDAAEQLLQQREQALEEREQALHLREMRAFAREQLQIRALPEALLPALCCRDEASCKESLDQVEKAFRTAVQEGVVERMRGQEPLRGELVPLEKMDDDAYYHMTYGK